MRGKDAITDEELARDGASGLEELFRRHQEGVYRYCLRMLRDPADAADAAQGAWLKAHLALASDRTAVLLVRPWLYAIARNECLDRIRGRRDARSIDVTDLELAGGERPEEAHEHRAELDDLLSDLAGLSERQRSAIVMREMAGLDADQLAEALETTPTRALGLVSDARRMLVERRSGRMLPCQEARGELGRARRRSGRVRAHLESCPPCQSFERSRRGRLLSSAGFAPLPFLRGLLERAAAFGGPLSDAPGALKAGAAAALVLTGAAGLGAQATRTEPAHAAPQALAQSADADAGHAAPVTLVAARRQDTPRASAHPTGRRAAPRDHGAASRALDQAAAPLTASERHAPAGAIAGSTGSAGAATLHVAGRPVAVVRATADAVVSRAVRAVEPVAPVPHAATAAAGAVERATAGLVRSR